MIDGSMKEAFPAKEETMNNETREYKRADNVPITAVRLSLELGDEDGMAYYKWGGWQRAKQGDWLVNRHDGEAYTIDAEVFAATYTLVSPGVYDKVTNVWARVAESDGVIETKEGETNYVAGDMIVFNQADETDGYAMTEEKFAELYVEA